jgi:cytochrome P450
MNMNNISRPLLVPSPTRSRSYFILNFPHRRPTVRRSLSLAAPQSKPVDAVREKEVVSNVQEGCPITGLTGASSKNYPKLFKVPSLPVLGTLWHHYSGSPRLDLSDAYSFHPKCRKRFGNFYTLGFPGFGSGLHGTVHVTTDPEEMVKVVRSEGSYPSGVVENLWMIRKVLKDSGSPLVEGNDYGLFDNGERWKRHRTFLQTGMLDPRAAKRFVPGIQEAARLASPGAPARRKCLNEYLHYCAFDMFNTFMLGELTRCADPQTGNEPGNEENIEFCTAAVKMMDMTGAFTFSPYETFMGNVLGIRTAYYKEFQAAWDIVNRIGTKKVHRFLERYENGTLTKLQKDSYLAGAIERQSSGSSEITMEEMIALCVVSLLVSVDTTSTVTAWNLVHLAVHQDVQEKLYTELFNNEQVGVPKEKVTERSTFPYLHACIRETHRITPPSPLSLIKRNRNSEVVVNGITFPKDTTFALDHITNDPHQVAHADQFIPERWLAESVQSRKGSNDDILDNPLFRDPFGQGARRCPGSRVATNEVLCMIAQLVSDYKIVAKEKSLNEIRHESRLFIQPIIPELQFIPR